MGNRLFVRSFMSIAVVLVLVLSSTQAANADSLAITFEPPYHLGSIDQQQGWAGTGGVPINPAIDEEIVNNPGFSHFGTQSWRMSNAYTDGAFALWPYSPSLHNEAGEADAQSLGFSGGVRQNHFEVQWDFASTVKTAEQAGLQVSTSPDRGDGARMSFIRMEDLPGGLAVQFADYQDKAPFGSATMPANGCGPGGDDFVITTVATGLSRSVPHTVKLTMDFINGARNDVVKVFVDGHLRLTGTSWEDFFRWCEGTQNSRTVDSMLFQARTSGGEAVGTLGHGFLFDNLSYASSQRECRKGHGDGDFEDDHGHRHHASFHHDDCDNDRGHFEDDDRDSGKHFESTSTDSATYTSTADGTTLTMIGTGLDDGLPVGFTMVAVDHGTTAPAIYSMTLTNGRTFTGTLVSGVLELQ